MEGYSVLADGRKVQISITITNTGQKCWKARYIVGDLTTELVIHEYEFTDLETKPTVAEIIELVAKIKM